MQFMVVFLVTGLINQTSEMSEENMDARVVVSARVSKEAATGWRAFCDENGISLSALLEVAGRQLANETFPPRVEERRKMVEEARKIDIQRRARR